MLGAARAALSARSPVAAFASTRRAVACLGAARAAAPAGSITFVEETEDYEKEIAKPLTVVNFTASWCGPCRQIAPVYETLASQNKDVSFIKIDVDKAADIASSAAISAVPSFLFFKAGKRVGGFSGADVTKLTDFIRKIKAMP